MKDQRIQDAFDAFNPDDDALDRMWAKISAAYDEQVGNDGEGEEYKAGVSDENASSAGEATERSVLAPEENRVAVASVADRSAEAGTSAAGASVQEAGGSSAHPVQVTVTPGRRRARVHSWVFGAVAACLVLAIGVGMSLGSGMFSTSDNASSSSSTGSEDNNAAGEPMLESTSSTTSDETQDTATWNGYSDGLHVESLVGGRVEFDDGTAEDVLDMQVNFGSVDFRCASAEPAEPDTVGDFLGVATWSFPDIGELSDLLNVYALASDTSGVAVPDTILVEIPLADGSAVYYPFNQV